MQVAYHAKGTLSIIGARLYLPNTANRPARLAGGSLEALVTEEVLKSSSRPSWSCVFKPLPIWSANASGWTEPGKKRLERARIEARRAARQYHAVEPEDRLVA
jgi:hypothetical protein